MTNACAEHSWLHVVDFMHLQAMLVITLITMDSCDFLQAPAQCLPPGNHTTMIVGGLSCQLAAQAGDCQGGLSLTSEPTLAEDGLAVTDADASHLDSLKLMCQILLRQLVGTLCTAA